MSIISWRDHVDSEGDFELALYVYRLVLALMKQSLDLGTLLSDDDARLQAYRHQVKGAFKAQWLQFAEALEAYGAITPCICTSDEYCRLCSGSRYHLNDSVEASQMMEIVTLVARDEEIKKKLENALGIKLEESEANGKA